MKQAYVRLFLKIFPKKRKCKRRHENRVILSTNGGIYDIIKMSGQGRARRFAAKNKRTPPLWGAPRIRNEKIGTEKGGRRPVGGAVRLFAYGGRTARGGARELCRARGGRHAAVDALFLRAILRPEQPFRHRYDRRLPRHRRRGAARPLLQGRRHAVLYAGYGGRRFAAAAGGSGRLYLAVLFDQRRGKFAAALFEMHAGRL